MFSWSKKKEGKKRERRGDGNSEENEFGFKMEKGPSDKQLEAELRALAGVDELPDDDINLKEGEEDEESELLRLIGGKAKKTPRKAKESSDEVPSVDVMANITGEIDVGEEDVEVDENDPDLLSELLELTQPEDDGEVEEADASESDSEQPKSSGGEADVLSVLKDRLKMYKAAETKAKESNESSRARRFSRGIKTIEDLIKKVKAGKAVSPADIPPVIALNLKPAPPVSAENSQEGDVNETGESENPGISSEPEDLMTTLMERLKMYQSAEAKAKETGETTRARRFNRGIKTIEGLINQVKLGKSISSDDIPPVVALHLKPPPPPSSSSNQEESTRNSEDVENEMGEVNLDSTVEDASVSRNFDEPERNITDVLAERLKMYQEAEEKAREADESSRARRFERGIKTLRELIRKTADGKQISPEEIPPPIALHLTPPAPASDIAAQEEEPQQDPSRESENLVQSSDNKPLSPIKFTPVDDEGVDWDEDMSMLEEEAPATVMEGLEQRLRIYSKLLEKAQTEGDENSVIQNEKLVKIYTNAIITYKNGGFVDVLKLPNPKGCPPIPIPFHIP